MLLFYQRVYTTKCFDIEDPESEALRHRQIRFNMHCLPFTIRSFYWNLFCSLQRSFVGTRRKTTDMFPGNFSGYRSVLSGDTKPLTNSRLALYSWSILVGHDYTTTFHPLDIRLHVRMFFSILVRKTRHLCIWLYSMSRKLLKLAKDIGVSDRTAHHLWSRLIGIEPRSDTEDNGSIICFSRSTM